MHNSYDCLDLIYNQVLPLQSAALEHMIADIIKNEQSLYASIQTAGAAGLNSETYRQISKKLGNLNFILHKVVNTWIPNPDYPFDKQLQQLLSRYPNHPLIYKLFAEYCAEKQMYDRSESYYQKMLSIEPRSIEGLRGLARLYENTERYNDALLVCMRLVELDLPQEASYRYAVSMAEKTDQLEKLGERWEQLYRVHRDNETLKTNLIFVWNKLGRNDKVSQLLNP